MTAGNEKKLCLCLGSAEPDTAINGNYDTVLRAATLQKAAETSGGESENKHSELLIVVASSELSSNYHPMELSSYTKILAPTATVSVRILSSGDDIPDLQPIHTSFLLAGLVGTSERREEDGSRVLTASKIPKDVSLAPKTLNVKRNGTPAVTLDEDNLIDEDALLTDNSNLLAPPPAMSAAAAKNGDDCSGREPCDDCTCGRAEQKAAEKKASAETKKVGSCGKCGLGDAFRCANCPHLGKPAFKADEMHLVLDLQDDL